MLGPQNPTASTFLMFQGGADDAIALYESAFRQWRTGPVHRRPATPQDTGGRGMIEFAVAELNGHRILVSDSDVRHEFTFTPSISLFVVCADRDELDVAHRALMAGGTELMPLGDYGMGAPFAWIEDRFKVSWQLTHARPGADGTGEGTLGGPIDPSLPVGESSTRQRLDRPRETGAQ